MLAKRASLTLKLVFILLISVVPAYGAEIVRAESFGVSWPFQNEKSGMLYCKKLGNGRKAVWLNGTNHTYALNGQAMSWMIDSGLQGVDGGPVLRGRDHSTNYQGLNKLIRSGLKLCK